MRAAAALPDVVDADDRDAVLACLGDRGLRRAIHHYHAVVVAAVEQCRHRSFAPRLHRCARPAPPWMLGHVQDLGQSRVLIAAQRRIDHMIADDARFLGIEADAPQGPLRERTSLFDTQLHALRLYALHGNPVRRSETAYERLRAMQAARRAPQVIMNWTSAYQPIVCAIASASKKTRRGAGSCPLWQSG